MSQILESSIKTWSEAVMLEVQREIEALPKNLADLQSQVAVKLSKLKERLEYVKEFETCDKRSSTNIDTDKNYEVVESCEVSVVIPKDIAVYEDTVLISDLDNALKVWKLGNKRAEVVKGVARSAYETLFQITGKGHVVLKDSEGCLRSGNISNIANMVNWSKFTASNSITKFQCLPNGEVAAADCDGVWLYGISSERVHSHSFCAAMDVAPNGSVLTALEDGTVMLSEKLDGQWQHSTIFNCQENVKAIQALPSGQVALLSKDYFAVWEMQSEGWKVIERFGCHCSSDMRVASDKKVILLGYEGDIQIWEKPSVSWQKTSINLRDSMIKAFSIDPEGRIYTADVAGRVSILEGR